MVIRQSVFKAAHCLVAPTLRVRSASYAAVILGAVFCRCSDPLRGARQLTFLLYLAWRGLPHARARERVVPISELVFGTLTQNWSSLEPLGFAAVAGPPCSVNRVPYVQAVEEPKRDPKRLWRTRLDGGPASRPQTGSPKILRRMPELNVIPSRLPFEKSTAKGPPFSMRGVPAQDYSGFGLKFQTSARKSAQLSRARACGSRP
jgi:hypothetical protein